MLCQIEARVEVEHAEAIVAVEGGVPPVCLLLRPDCAELMGCSRWTDRWAVYVVPEGLR